MLIVVEIIKVALGALRANKLRSFLTLLGIMIGVSAVIAMDALGRGAQRSVNERIAALGTTLLTVMPGQAVGAGGVRQTDQQRMTIDDARAIEERATTITAVQPEMQRQLQVQFGNRNTNTQIVGTTANYLPVRRFTMGAGRMFSPGEDAARKRVAVLGPAVLENLGLDNPQAIIGEMIRIRGLQFEVIGVLQSKGQGGGFFNPDDMVLIPLETAQYRVFGTDRLRSVNVLAQSEQRIPEAMAEIQKILRREHRLREGRPDDFVIRNQSDFLATFAETTKTFSYLLAGIAAVSLLVGGIGIMNIMLVSVTERTKEIGIRKALGATRRAVLLQFMVEAVVLCLLGGVIGVVIGGLGATALTKLANFNTEISTQSIVIAFVCSAVVGVVFGVWPARRAARMDPIMALRYE